MSLRKSRRLGAALLGVVLALAAASDGAAAQGTSPTDDLIARVRADVNDLRYADAIRRGHEVFAFAPNMRPAQVIALRATMAAAFYPEELAEQRSDSALAHLSAIIRLAPDATLPVELRWSGLDSLYEVARSRTLAVAVRPAAQDSLVGTDGRAFISVIASRPVRFRLRVAPLPTGASVLHDSTVTPDSRGQLGFRGHDGRTPLFVSGEYEFVVTAVDAVTGDSVTVRHHATATAATPLAPVSTPVLDTTKLLPESAKAPRVRMVMTSVFFAAATGAIAAVARAEEPIRSEYKSDGRAILVSVAMIGAAVGGFWLDKGTVSVENLRANMALRAAHLKALTDADAESKQRIAAYKVTVRIQPQAR
ncbi:MAG: hypothetical protein WD771_06915 [Gemmatimonadaceae bacterium]